MGLRGVIAAVLAALAVAACGSSTDQSNSGSSAKDNLVLSGPVKADSSSEKGGGCVWKPAVFGLTFTSGAMQGGAKVAFAVTVGVGAVGDESATDPAQANGQTPLTLVAGGKTLNATDGTIHVTEGDVQAKTFKGTIDGTFQDGTKVSGSWSCQAVLG
jgi:hypothetical protein